MKWAATFCGEISNSAFYFSSFGNVNDDNKSTIDGSLVKLKQHCTRGGEGGKFLPFGHNGCMA